MSAHIAGSQSTSPPGPLLSGRERRGSAGQAAPLRVFLVEDSPLVRDAFARTVVDPGRIEIVDYADSESSAIDGINRCLPDVVILDICLRDGSNGLNVLRSITQMVWIRLPLMIVLTSHPYPEYAKVSRELGADYFFDKTTEFDEVGQVLEAMADRKSAGASYM